MNDSVDNGPADVPDPVIDERQAAGSVTAWSPSPGLVGLAWVATAAAVVWCASVVSTGDRAGLLLAAVTVVGLGLAALYGTRARPRLRVDGRGLTVGGLTAPRHHPWDRVDDVRVLTVRRFGRASTLLEIDVTDPDGEERLLVFGRLDLDTDPDDVAAVLRRARPPRRPARTSEP